MEKDGAVERLVQRARSGDSLEEDFRELFERYYGRLFRFFSRRGFLAEESLDLTQETFLRVYKGLGRFGGEMRLATWIYQIARNLVHNEIRSRKTQKRDSSEAFFGEEAGTDSSRQSIAGESPLKDALVAERQRLLAEALAELPSQMRRCVELRVQDLKYREIAVILEISIDTVKAHLFQARQRLKEKLSDYFSDLESL